MKAWRVVVHRIGTLLLLLVLPLVGVGLAGKPMGPYLAFPPLTRYVEHAGFSWEIFTLLVLFTVAIITPFLDRCLACQHRVEPRHHSPGMTFPWWGWGGMALTAIAWVAAWTRFPWFAPWQPFTFSPLWLGYILTVNALTWKRANACMLVNRPAYFLALFVVSAGFWWFFEYLNRFVQNWYYVGIADFTPWQYVLFATLPFSTVLPAVLGTYELLETFPRLTAGLDDFSAMAIRPRRPNVVAGIMFVAACFGLAGIGVWPGVLFPMLWLAPLVIIVSAQALRGEKTIVSPIAQGDWRQIVLLALSGSICGFFWEMWNYRSLAKWCYSIPFVDAFRLFEMPILGYAGYLPFGLECAVAAAFFLGKAHSASPIAGAEGKSVRIEHEPQDGLRRPAVRTRLRLF